MANKNKSIKLKQDLLTVAKDAKELFNLKTINLNYVLVLLFIIAAFLVGFLANQLRTAKLAQTQTPAPTQQAAVQQQSGNQAELTKIQNEVIKKSYTFKIKWGNLGQRMIADGVIDKQKFTKAVTGKDSLPQDLDKYLSSDQSQIELTPQNAQFWVDVLWGLGLANKTQILEEGPMVEGGQTANFASTGGWTIGAKNPMQIYAKYDYIPLTDAQTQRVKDIASGIYRPCCDNPTSFPDCNHGMAALGLIELMVSQNFSDNDIYKAVLAFNTYWFPQTYLNTAYYFQQNGKDYSKVSAKEILSKTYSSASGSQVITQKVGNLAWPALQGGGSCGA